MKNIFYNVQVRAACSNNKSLYFHSDENEQIEVPHIFSSFIYASGTTTPGHSLQQFNTHDHFENLIYL